MPEENQPDLAGYPDVESLVKGYRASSDEAKKWRTTAGQLEQRLDDTRQMIPQRNVNGHQDPASRLSEYGVPVDALNELLNQRINEAFTPIAQGFQARNQMVSQHPDYPKFENDVAQFVNNDPELNQRYQRMFATDPAGAMEYAFLKYGNSKGGLQPVSDVTAKPKKEASLPNGRVNGKGPETPSQNDEQLAKAWDHYQKTGNPTAYAKARLRQAIPDSFLNQG